jgi:hypothetical protein
VLFFPFVFKYIAGIGKMDFLVPKGAKKEEFRDVNILTWSIMSNYLMWSSHGFWGERFS